MGPGLLPDTASIPPTNGLSSLGPSFSISKRRKNIPPLLQKKMWGVKVEQDGL